jgi:hypothetical protein
MHKSGRKHSNRNLLEEEEVEAEGVAPFFEIII